MKIKNHIDLHRLDTSKDYKKLFEKTESGKNYKITDIAHNEEYGLSTYTFSVEAKQTIPNLERKTIQNIFYGGITINLTFSIGIHKLTMMNIYKDIRNMVIRQIALDLIEAQQLRDYVIDKFVSKQQFCILKPHKAIKDKWIDSNPTHIYINKGGQIVPISLKKLGICYTEGVIGMLEEAIVQELVK